MIEKFRKKTIWIVTLIFWVSLVGILFVLNLSNYRSNVNEANRLLSTQEKIAESEDTTEAVVPNVNHQKISMIYSVEVDKVGNLSIAFSDSSSAYGEEGILKIAQAILEEGKESGVLNHFRYLIADIENGQMISFIENGIWENQQYRMLGYSALIGCIGMVVFFLVSVVLTGWLIQPVVASFERQKQFISDAGHELKTPLTVMKSSLDLMEIEYGSSKYLDYVKDENIRMTALVYEMLALSDLEVPEKKPEVASINFSRLTEGTCLPFESLAFEKGIHLELQIDKDIKLLGDEKQMRQLVEVLVDNAIKHTFLDGTVLVKLGMEKGKVVFEVKNQGEAIPKEERNKIFDRFYRVDKSRNRSEGRYGLGLSIASKIVEERKGKILVDCKDGWTTFSIRFH